MDVDYLTNSVTDDRTHSHLGKIKCSNYIFQFNPKVATVYKNANAWYKTCHINQNDHNIFHM